VQAYDAGRWLLLATLWSLQFLFLRVAVPVFGAAPVAEGRALLGALFLVPWVIFFARQRIAPLQHWKDYLALSLVNNVLPFVCYAFAATSLPAGYLAIIFFEELDVFVIIFIDDILVYSKTKDHVKHLRVVLQKLREHKLYDKFS